MSPARLVALVALTVLAVGIALALQRRRPDPPSAPSYRAPHQLDRNDFVSPARRLLLVLFASTTCDSCPKTWMKIQEVVAQLGDDGAELAVQRIDVQDGPELHTRYRIDGVPTTLVADHDGVVTQAFFGPITDEQLRRALEISS